MQYEKLNRVLKNYIEEANSTYATPDAGSGFNGGSYASFKVEDPEVFKQINSFLKSFGLQRHDDPKHSLVMLRTKLNTIGLDFSYDGRRSLSPNELFHMTQFGGRTGVDEKGNTINDCGISHRTGGRGIDLHVEITPVNPEEPGPYYMNIKMDFKDAMKGDHSPIETGEAADSLKKK